MNRIYLLLSLTMVSFSGCASVPPPARVSEVKITTQRNARAEVLGERIQEIDGRLAVLGNVRQTSNWTPIGPIHVDVQFFDINGKELMLKSTPIQLQRRFSRRSHAPAASFQISAEPWPKGTVRLKIKPHEGAEHQQYEL